MKNVNEKDPVSSFRAFEKKFDRAFIIIIIFFFLSLFGVIFAEKNYSSSLEKVVKIQEKIIANKDSTIMNYEHYVVEVEKIIKR